MAARQSTPDSHSDNVRKRVCKACDRCRLKKSKCDGASPCSRCRADNAVCVFGERKKAHDKVYPKGYVEMLEQQQAWLVNGLQELYRRTLEGEGWPGEILKTEPNGHPLTHDLLTALGALDHTKGEHFEENPENMQSDLWRHGMARQESSDGSSEAHSPIARSRFSSDAFSHSNSQSSISHSHSQSNLPPTPPAYSPSTRAQVHAHAQAQAQSNAQNQISPAQIKSESIHNHSHHQHQHQPQTPAQAQNQQYALSMQGVVNPLALQGPPPPSSASQWNGGNNGFNPFDEMDLMSTADYTNLKFEDSMASPMFGQISLNCVPGSGDYDDFNQFLNPNPTEITSI